MSEVTIYTTRFCPFCVQAKRLLSHKGIDFTEISVDGDRELRQQMSALSGRNTVPQIWVGERHVGGCDDLYALEGAGKLDSLLAQV